MRLRDGKILLVTGSLNQGGAEYQLLELAVLLKERGHKAEVMALTDYSHFLCFVREKGISYSCVKNDGRKIFRLFKVLKMIIGKKPALVISYLKGPSQIAILARIISGFSFKLIISERTSQIQPFKDLIHFNLALLSNAIIVNSQKKLKYITSRFPLLKKKSVFIPNIVDLEKYSKVQSQFYHDGLLRLTYVGRISNVKNLFNLVYAIKILSDKGYDVALSLVGESHNKCYLSDLTQLINELYLSEIIRYEGASNDMISIYEKSDLVCLVSLYEGFSNVLAESLACGLPVVVSNIEENEYIITDKINGFLVEPTEPVSIAEGIIKYLELDEIGRRKISENNREKAGILFDKEKIYTKYANLFNKV